MRQASPRVALDHIGAPRLDAKAFALARDQGLGLTEVDIGNDLGRNLVKRHAGCGGPVCRRQSGSHHYLCQCLCSASMGERPHAWPSEHTRRSCGSLRGEDARAAACQRRRRRDCHWSRKSNRPTTSQAQMPRASILWFDIEDDRRHNTRKSGQSDSEVPSCCM
jgi:hypothetical protein